MRKDSIFSEIDKQYNNLSKTFKLIADFVKDNYSTIPFLSIKELKEKIGVSTASITRFSQHMGFKGYPDFQKEIQGIVEKEIVPMREVKYFIENNDDKNILQETIDSNIKILQATYSDELYKNFNRAIEFIMKSRKVYILGCRSSYSAAYYLGFMLQGFMDNIELIDAGHQDFSNKLAHIRENDVLIAISFSQYTKFTSNIAQFFKDNGNRIIAITDSYSSPIAIKADATLLAKNGTNTFSFVSAMTILNALVVSLGKTNKKETLKKLKDQERIAIDTGIYI
ncbi:MurR/RpiR family transcriptional regulator [Wukongibacter sp. M2B1]|uniref:MurR/RpiR family transcriptional regulator n=1 Tax=Wukongibacter sp. M2B1 TaxID=3088895 RepID=UPI003D7B6096